MAIETGTASNHKDLLNKLETFLTGLASNPWVANRFTTDDELFLQGEGSSGNDQIYCSIKINESIASDYFNWSLAGAIAYSAIDDQVNQPGASPLVYTSFWDDTMPYWFVANGRRFIVIAKVSTTYHGLHCGFILPYGTPNQYPYPLWIGGETNGSTKRWSSTNLRMFWDPVFAGTYLRRIDGQWLDIYNFGTAENAQLARNIQPYQTFNANLFRTVGTGLPPGGEYPLFPLQIIENIPTLSIIGEIEGCFAISGFSNAAENTVTVNANNHVIFQNVFRTNIYDYMALEQT